MSEETGTKKKRVKVSFVDGGQDCLWWEIEDGKVVACNLQGWMWNGTEVYNLDTVKPGGYLEISLNPNLDLPKRKKGKHTFFLLAVEKSGETSPP